MRLWIVPVPFLVALGCATVSRDRLVEPPKYISAAEEAGSKDVPEAELHLKMAKDGYARAQKLISDGEDDEAERVLARSAADARLALELARAKSTRDEAEAAKKKIDDLRMQP